MNSPQTKLHSRTRAIFLTASPVLFWGVISSSFLHKLEENPALYWAHEFIAWIFLPLGCLLFLYKRYGIGPAEYGLDGTTGLLKALNNLPVLLLTTLALLSFFPVQFVAWWAFPPPIGAFSYAHVIPSGMWGKLVIVYLAISAALVEEIFFRGLLKEVLVGNDHELRVPWLFVLGSALLFGLNHWGQGFFQVIATFYFGIVTAVAYWKLKNLWFLILGHFVVNMLAK